MSMTLEEFNAWTETIDPKEFDISTSCFQDKGKDGATGEPYCRTTGCLAGHLVIHKYGLKHAVDMAKEHDWTVFRTKALEILGVSTWHSTIVGETMENWKWSEKDQRKYDLLDEEERLTFAVKKLRTTLRACGYLPEKEQVNADV